MQLTFAAGKWRNGVHATARGKGRWNGYRVCIVVSMVSLVGACLFVHSGPCLLLQATKRTTLFCIVERARTVRNSFLLCGDDREKWKLLVLFLFFGKYVESRRMFVRLSKVSQDYTENNFESICDSERKKMKNYFEVSSALRSDLEVKWYEELCHNFW